MTVRLLACVLAALAPTLASGAQTKDVAPAPTPAQLVMNLENLQVKIAQGDAAAQAAQSKMLREIAAAFSSADASVWREPASRQAAIAYLLSGGAPGVITQLLEKGSLSKDDSLIQGALAYVSGRTAEARSLLDGLDANTLDLRIAGQVAFVQSMLETSEEDQRAIDLLDLARLLAPGSLIEEAALRREIFLAGDMRDIDRFTMLSREYVSRFPHSVYADNFVQGFGSIVARLGLAETLADFHKFDDVAALLTPDERRGLFFVIARAALMKGKVEVAGFAANLALQQTPADSNDAARAQLYEGAAHSLTAQYDAGLEEMQKIDPKRLDKKDAAILAAALDLALRLHKPPDPGVAAADSKPLTPSVEDGSMATVKMAETAVAQADSFLHEKAQ